MTAGKILLGVVAGIATGALLGVLFAPEKGCDTRRKIGQKKDDLTDDLKEKFNSFLDTISQKFEVVNEEVSDFTDKAEVKINDMKKS
jgi:gas vesicle protein